MSIGYRQSRQNARQNKEVLKVHYKQVDGSGLVINDY